MENNKRLKAIKRMGKEEPLSEAIMNIVRGFTRPALTFFGLVSWVMLFANGFDIPAAFTWLVWGMVIWWFGDRTYFKAKTRSNGDSQWKQL